MKFVTPRNRRGKGAFTLIEIMIVVVMIGILAAIAIPAFQKLTKRSQNTAFVNDLRIASEAIQRYSLETGDWPPDGGGTLPVQLTGYLPPPDRWSLPTPVGGLWAMSRGATSTDFRASLTVSGYVGGTARAAEIDKQIDDGDPATGFLQASGTTLTYVLER
jgi:prepilin-type N-terminal cleavage/methylation domain-containing protein